MPIEVQLRRRPLGTRIRVKRSSIFSKGRRWSNADINEQYARLLRLGRLLKTIAASLAVSGTEAREKRVAGAEDGCPKQQ
jgi:hypothetical protein